MKKMRTGLLLTTLIGCVSCISYAEKDTPNYDNHRKDTRGIPGGYICGPQGEVCDAEGVMYMDFSEPARNTYYCKENCDKRFIKGSKKGNYCKSIC